VPVSTEPTFRAGTARLLFQANSRSLDVHPVPGGDRFLMVKLAGQEERVTLTADVNVPPPHTP
jgi:hypothetical protein